MAAVVLSSARRSLQQLYSLGPIFNHVSVVQNFQLVRKNGVLLRTTINKCCYSSTRHPSTIARPGRKLGINFEKNVVGNTGIEVTSQSSIGVDTPKRLNRPQALEIREAKNNWADEPAQHCQLMSGQQWQEMKTDLISSGRIRDDGCFESYMMIACTRRNNYSLGRSLLNFIEASGDRPNLVTLSKFLRLCGQNKDGQVSESSIFDVYDKLMKHGPLFDGTTAEDIVHGLCGTSKWREAMTYLDMMTLTGRFQSPTSLLAIIAAAFRDGDHELGWDLLKSAVDQRFLISDDVLLAWIDCCCKGPRTDQRNMSERMLYFLRDHEVVVGQRTIDKLKYFYESLVHEDWQVTLTTVSGRGVCKSCKNMLEDIKLTSEEFEELKSNFISKVIEGNDLYQKSSPAELQRFQNFMHYTAPYSVVVDGLNVAYGMQKSAGNPSRLARQLLAVVKHLSRGQKRKMLVLGRQHMKLWPKMYLNEIQKEAVVFYTENLSKDDPYMLYAALCSGPGTLFVSKDMMRDHKFCFAQDTKLVSHFRKWQWGHQIQIVHVGNDGEVVIKPAVTHNPVAQVVDENWHIPYDDGSERLSYLIPNSWLCLKKRAVPLNLKSTRTKLEKKSLASGK